MTEINQDALLKKEAEKVAEEIIPLLHQKKELGLFLGGIGLGIFGNILADCLLDKKLFTPPIDGLKMFFFVVSVIVVFGTAWFLLKRMEEIDSEIKKRDNIVRAYYKADEYWNWEGRLIKNDKP